MNSLLLGLESSGTLNTALSVFIAGEGAPWYSTSDMHLDIGDIGIHCDYRDASSQQISHHIWSYTSSAAGGIIPNATANAAITHVGVYLHEHIDFGLDGTWQDYLAGIVAVALGRELHANRVSPRNFGNAFRSVFQLDFCTVMPHWSICTNPNRAGRDAYQFLEEYSPLWFGEIVDRDETGCP